MATNIDFAEWLTNELAVKGWDQAELSRRSGITTAHISRIMTGQRHPGSEALSGIARALRLPPEELFRRAGLLPPKRGVTADDQARYNDMLEAVRSLSPDGQKLLFEILETIKRSEENSRGR